MPFTYKPYTSADWFWTDQGGYIRMDSIIAVMPLSGPYGTRPTVCTLSESYTLSEDDYERLRKLINSSVGHVLFVPQPKPKRKAKKSKK
jgi:hypothetical protein